MTPRSVRGPRRTIVAIGVGCAVLLVSAGSTILAATPPVVQTRRALDHVAQAAIAWQNQFNCSGCHKQTLALAAIGVGSSQGHDAPLPGVVDQLVDGMLEGTSGQDAQGCFSFGGAGKFTMATTFGGRGLEVTDRYLRGDLAGRLLAAADCLLTKQSGDGRLPADTTELPVSQGDFITTAHAVYTWKRALDHAPDAAYGAAADQALFWLAARIPALEAAPGNFTTQDKSMLLAGLAAGGVGVADPLVERMHVLLASAQLPDGSWKIQHSVLGGNAHGTGQAVFALRAAGFGLEDPLVSAGRSWLLAHQATDGSWPASNWTGGTPSQVAPSMWGALALATFPSPLATLRLHGESIEWLGAEGAASYDLIRGAVSELGQSPSGVDLGAVECLAAAQTSTSVRDGDDPAPGEAFFYLFRIRWDNEHDIYGRSSSGLDRVPSAGDCPG